MGTIPEWMLATLGGVFVTTAVTAIGVWQRVKSSEWRLTEIERAIKELQTQVRHIDEQSSGAAGDLRWVKRILEKRERIRMDAEDENNRKR